MRGRACSLLAGAIAVMVLHEAAEINTHGSWLMALFDLSMVEVIWAGVYTIHKFERW